MVVSTMASLCRFWFLFLLLFMRRRYLLGTYGIFLLMPVASMHIGWIRWKAFPFPGIENVLYRHYNKLYQTEKLLAYQVAAGSLKRASSAHLAPLRVFSARKRFFVSRESE